MKKLRSIFFAFTLIACNTPTAITPSTYQSESLVVQPVTENVFVHTSQLMISFYGTFPCNGMLFRHGDEVLIFDTPVNDTVSHELIDFVEQQLQCQVKGIVATHFHDDCLGGLAAFHQRGIPSYAQAKTIALAQQDSLEVPQHGFNDVLKLQLGKTIVINQHYGAGHTVDNIVSYVPSEKVLFGGCLIKSEGAGKGNLADADVQAWSTTVARIKAALPDLQYVIPGHGDHGDTSLLNYTIALFEQSEEVIN